MSHRSVHTQAARTTHACVVVKKKNKYTQRDPPSKQQPTRFRVWCAAGVLRSIMRYYCKRYSKRFLRAKTNVRVEKKNNENEIDRGNGDGNQNEGQYRFVVTKMLFDELLPAGPSSCAHYR